jgi:hypothetical protein
MVGKLLTTVVRLVIRGKEKSGLGEHSVQMAEVSRGVGQMGEDVRVEEAIDWLQFLVKH